MIISFLIGLLIGVLYFGGLYYSTQKFNDVRSPGLFMSLSMLIRMGILLVGLYYLAQSGYKSVLIGFLGIMIIRFVSVSKVKRETSDINLERE